MKPDSKNNKKFLKQFPFLNWLLRQELAPLAGKGGVQVDDLTIKVEKADGDLLFRETQDRGCLGDKTISECNGGARKGQVIKRGEHLFAFSEDGEPLNTLAHNENVSSENLPIYAEQIFWRNIQGDMRSQPIFKDVKYLVWVTVVAYYKDSGDANDPYGEFVDRTLEATIYKEPKEGFLKLERDSRLEDHLLLSNGVFMDDALRKNRQLDGVKAHLQELADIFYEFVYCRGMEEILEEVNFKGSSGEFGGVSVKAGWGLGRVGIGLSNSEIELEFQIVDETKVMYMGYVYGRLPAIRQLVMNVVLTWSDEEARESFGPDKSVKNFGQVIAEAVNS